MRSMSLRRWISCAQPCNLCNHLTRSTSCTHSQILSPIPSSRSNARISASKPTTTTSTCNLQSVSQSRSFHSSTINLSSSSSSSSSSSQQQLKDEQIKSPFVRLVTDQGLSNQASKTKDILREMDRSQYWLVQVKAGLSTDPIKPKHNGNGNGHDSGNRKGGRRKSEEEETSALEEPSTTTSNRPVLENLPLVKFISKKEAYDKAKALKLQKKSNSSSSSSSSTTLSDLSKSSSSSPKLIQLTWSVSPNDLDHKLKNARKDLINKGTKVKVEVITKKGGGKSVAGGEMEKKKLEFLKKVEEVVCEELRIYEEAEAKEGEGEGGEGKLKEVRKGRRMGEIEWKNNGAVARCTFELVRSKS